MPSFDGLPASWEAFHLEDRVLYKRNRNNNHTQDVQDFVDWAVASGWEGFQVLDYDYAMTPGGEMEYKFPYHIQMVRDKMHSARVYQERTRFGAPRFTIDEESTICNGCYTWGIPMTFVERNGVSGWLCDRCNPVCSSCGENNNQNHKIYTGQYDPRRGNTMSTKNTLCSKCLPLIPCHGCDHIIPRDGEFTKQLTVDKKTIYACMKCVDRFVCTTCQEWGARRPGGKSCNACFVKQFDKIVKHEPKFAVGMLPAGGLSFPALPQRPFRTISIETEMDGDKDALSSVLYACGIIKNPRVEEYRSYPDHSAEWLCHLKHDGTATAGELISHLLDLSDKTHSDGMIDMLRRLYGLEKMGLIQYGSGCGGHIHIDAHNYDWDDVYRLWTIFGYVEDVLYRIAGAGSSYGHRSLDKGARNPLGLDVGSYSKPLRKGPFGSRENFIMTMKGEQDRGHALNLLPYTQAIGNCRCKPGQHGKLKFCTCNLGKATIEWRIWNSTGNPRILHAWIAIMQAMHAFCEGEGEPAEEWLNQYPAFAYTGKKWENNLKSHADTAKQRIEWMLRELVFTPEERKSILYAVENSDMQGMFNIRERAMYHKMGVLEQPPKVLPRNPVRRERSISIKSRTPDEIRQVKEGPLVARR